MTIEDVDQVMHRAAATLKASSWDVTPSVTGVTRRARRHQRRVLAIPMAAVIGLASIGLVVRAWGTGDDVGTGLASVSESSEYVGIALPATRWELMETRRGTDAQGVAYTQADYLYIGSDQPHNHLIARIHAANIGEQSSAYVDQFRVMTDPAARSFDMDGQQLRILEIDGGVAIAWWPSTQLFATISFLAADGSPVEVSTTLSLLGDVALVGGGEWDRLATSATNRLDALPVTTKPRP